jgi:hypothetical protein
MVNNNVVRFVKEKKQDVSCEEGLLHFSLKMLCFAGIFPYEKVCNTPKKLKLYHLYQIILYILYLPIIISQIVKLYLILEDLQEAIDTITHIVMGFGSYFVVPSLNWYEVHTLIRKIDVSMANRTTTQIDRNTTKSLRAVGKICKFMSLSVIILGIVGLFFYLYDIFILHFVESIVGVEHKYKMNPNAANILESLLLEKYPFSCWTPFGEKSVTAHLAMYIYTVIPVFVMALKSGSVTCTLFGIMIYISLKFKFVTESLEKLNNVENSDSQMEQNASTSPDKPNTSEKSKYRNCQVSATDDESFHTSSQAQTPECSNKPKHTNTSITTAHCVKDQEQKADCDRLPSDNKSAPEDCLITIIKNHQEAIW